VCAHAGPNPAPAKRDLVGPIRIAEETRRKSPQSAKAKPSRLRKRSAHRLGTPRFGGIRPVIFIKFYVIQNRRLRVAPLGNTTDFDSTLFPAWENYGVSILGFSVFQFLLGPFFGNPSRLHRLDGKCLKATGLFGLFSPF
jgi:hypothetical protein